MNTLQFQDRESPVESRTSSRVRKIAIALGTVAAAGVSAMVAHKNGVSAGEVYSTFQSIIHGQITPNPPTYPEVVDGMVETNEFLRKNAPLTVLGAASVWGVAKFSPGFRHEYAASKQDYVVDHTSAEGQSHRLLNKLKRPLAGVGLATVAVFITGGSSGLEHEISNGPLRPVDRVFDELSGDSQGDRYIIVQSEKNSFMDDADVNKQKLHALAERAAKVGVNVVPFNKSLQNIDNEPGLVFTIPDRLFTQATHQEIDKSCDTIPVILGDGSAKEVGQTVSINGVEAQVAEKSTGGGQMNRIDVALAESDYECIEEQRSETTFGAIVSGGELGQAQEVFSKDPLAKEATMITEQAFKDNNREFWRKNGTPLVLQLIGYVGMLSGIALSNARRGALQRSEKAIATLHSQGTSFVKIALVETTRSVSESLKATGLAAAPMLGMVTFLNMAESGLKVGAGLTELAVGSAITMGAKVAAGLMAVRRFRKDLNMEGSLKE